MDRIAATVILLGVLASLVLMILALFAVAPVVCSCLLSLIYTLYLFMAYEEAGVHHAQEYENRFWTIFALLFSTALFFAKDSPLGFGTQYPSLGFLAVALSSYVMHVWDRYLHRLAIGQYTKLRRSSTNLLNMHGQEAKETMEELKERIHLSLRDIDQLFIPSTFNNVINQRFVLKKEKEIITTFKTCDAVALNYLVCHVKLGLLIYKVKDHRNFSGQHRTELVQLLAVDRLPALTVMSRVIVLHALQILKLRANPRAENWVKNILLNTHGDDLSELKTLTDAKGDYFCMNKLIFDDIKSETTRQDILAHIRKEGALQVSHRQLGTRRAQRRQHMAWRKILSDVDDTLFSSGGSYPAGCDKSYAKKVVYPGVLAFYRELDLGTSGPDEWPENGVGNLVFLSARPHVYKDLSEKTNFEKFEQLRIGDGERKGMHTVPSLLPGDIASGSQFFRTNDAEPLAKKKHDNFKQYMAIYPEYKQVFVCDNGQGDVKAGELMFESFPYELEAVYVHVVQDLRKTYGYAPELWRSQEFKPCFFLTYPQAALHAATQDPPLIRPSGLRRVCDESVKDFNSIPKKKWTSHKQKSDRRVELNQGIWKANHFLEEKGLEPVKLVQAERYWKDGDKVNTPYGRGVVKGFDPENNMYDIAIDWRPLDVQVNEHLQKVKEEATRPRSTDKRNSASAQLETVVETDEATDDEGELSGRKPGTAESTGDQPSTKISKRAVQKGGSDGKTNGAEPDVKASNSATGDSSSVSSISSDGSHQDQGSNNPRSGGLQVTAKIDGRYLSRYKPPHLPDISKKSTSLVSFWMGSASQTPKQPASAFNEGDKCTTPYGLATVVEHRVSEKVVVVDMIGWKARGYYREDSVKVEKEGILASLFRRPSLTADAPAKLEFPYAQGTVIQSPYGEAEVVRPLPSPSKKEGGKVEADPTEPTMALTLKSWTLSDGSHPKVYCTAKTAEEWKEAKVVATSDGLFSAFGTLVSSTFDFRGRFSSQKSKEDEPAPAKFERYYSDSAAVSTAFGNGRIVGFRETDGFYEIKLTGWSMSKGKQPTAWLRDVDISYQIAKGCQEGYPVLTTMGLSGILDSVQPATGVHIVTVPSAGMVMYLQPEAIVRPLKAAVGEEALTAYGEGTVESYNVRTDVYTIQLLWGATLYVKADRFDRVRDSMHDKDGPFGMNWLLKFFFSSKEEKSDGTVTRSRSNSVVSALSGSGRSQSARSLT